MAKGSAKTAANKKKGAKPHRSMVRFIATTKLPGKSSYSFVEEMVDLDKVEERYAHYSNSAK